MELGINDESLGLPEFSFVDPLGLEPRMTEPKSAVLPITPWVYSISFSKSDAKLGNSKVLSNT
jgi:hypothetical protein